ncbi:MAG: ParB N-terminal domain-containing protein [Nitrospina sp.]|nr:ParB N-terminal domain-containing protein [Nitrospina sp.]MBT6717708.1 ParB N-terminal domain-containing protein [Nitrospina sp.]
MDSVKEVGIRHPISVCSDIKPYKIISGHKRVRAAIKAGLTRIPAFLVATMTDALVLNLKENFALRHYSDIEKGCTLNKLVSEGIQEDTIIDLYMPLLELERSKKIFRDLILVEKISSGLQKLLHRSSVPLKVFQVFFTWNNEDQKSAEEFFSITRPGANKWRDLLELVEEISTRDNISPKDFFSAPATIKFLDDKDLTRPQKYDRVHQSLQQKRYPVLSDLKKQVARALDEMKLDDKTRFKYQEAFESDEMKLELKFRDERELSQQVEKIFQALQSGSVEKLIKIINHR